jgi:methylenetetrahydrofolate reductase (NADPH)
MRTFARALASKSFTVTAEMSPLGNTSAGDILRQAKKVAPFVDGIQVTENPQHWMQVSPLAMAALLLREGIDPVTHLNCRDRNRRALQSDLAGLRDLGVSSLILNRGNLIQNPGALTGKPVYDINCRELISMAAQMSEKKPGEPGQEFMIGTSAIVFRPNAGWKAELYQTRAKAGARFLQTQPCFSVPMLRHFMQRLVDLRATWKFAVVVTLAPLPGMEAARWQFEDAQGTVIPKTVIREIAAAPDPVKAGIEICARQMQEIAAVPGVSGVNLLTLGNPSAVIAAIEASGLRQAAPVKKSGTDQIIR